MHYVVTPFSKRFIVDVAGRYLLLLPLRHAVQ